MVVVMVLLVVMVLALLLYSKTLSAVSYKTIQYTQYTIVQSIPLQSSYCKILW